MQRAYGELGAKAMTWPGGKASRETRWPARANVVPSLRVTTSLPHGQSGRLAPLEQVLQDEHAGPFGEAGDDGRERQPGDLGQVQAAAQQQARSFGGQLRRSAPLCSAPPRAGTRGRAA